MRTTFTAFFFFCLMLWSAPGWTQQFHPFPGNEFLYGFRDTAQDSLQRLLVVDSLYAQGNDSIYLFNRSFYDDSSYFYIDRDNVVGEGLRISANGNMSFFTSSGDSFHVPVAISVGDSFNYGSGTIGVLQQVTTETIFGQVDSVRTYELDGALYRLSQNHGWLDLPVLVPQTYNYIDVMHLEGIQSRQLGARQPTLGEYISWQPGDSLQRRREGGSFFYVSTIYRDLKVLTRVDQGDSITLTLRQQRYGEEESYDPYNPYQNIIYRTIDTITWIFPGTVEADFYTVWDSAQIFHDVAEPAGSADENFIRYDLKVDSQGRRLYLRIPTQGFFLQSPPYEHNNYQYYAYLELLEGVGEVFRTASDFDGGFEDSLICYRRPQDSMTTGLCEDPLNYPLVSRSQPNPLAVDIGPNPFTTQIRIEVRERVVAEITNLQGQVLRRDIALEPGLNSVSLEELPAGIYLLRLSGEDGASAVQKLLKTAQ